jgi:hypothetical protein
VCGDTTIYLRWIPRRALLDIFRSGVAVCLLIHDSYNVNNGCSAKSGPNYSIFAYKAQEKVDRNDYG